MGQFLQIQVDRHKTHASFLDEILWINIFWFSCYKLNLDTIHFWLALFWYAFLTRDDVSSNELAKHKFSDSLVSWGPVVKLTLGAIRCKNCTSK